MINEFSLKTPKL